MIKFVQNNGEINNKRVAWVDVYYIDEDGRDYRLTIHKSAKIRLNAFLRAHGFKIGVLGDGESVDDKVMI